jgi:hypothetical protein
LLSCQLRFGFGGFVRSLASLRVLEIRLDLAGKLDRDRLAMTVQALAAGDPDPAFEMEYSSTSVRSRPLKRMPTPRRRVAASKCGLRGFRDSRSGGVSAILLALPG